VHRALVGLLVVALAPAGCAGRGAALPAGERSPSAPDESDLSAQVLLPSTRVPTGGTLPGRVIIENHGTRPLQVSGCGSPFVVVLANHAIRPEVAWPLCLEEITIPTGTSRWPVTIAATYVTCGVGEDVVPCEDGDAPPLPVGRYRAVLVQNPHVVARPTPLEVRVVPCGCAVSGYPPGASVAPTNRH
jgi:hypothetical protein